MGKSAKFYKKPTLKEKQLESKNRSSASSSTFSTSAKDRAITTVSHSLKKSTRAKQEVVVSGRPSDSKGKDRRQGEGKPVVEVNSSSRFKARGPDFRPSVGGIRKEEVGRARVVGGEDEEMMEDEEEEQDEEEGDKPKRRFRSKLNKKNYGPMPKDMGIDYVGLWNKRQA
ncbi:hypothetical protein IE53DRAFT_390733 [Violaceomyces palustris]|uniref:Uncharacterized protein n=1 Tax=Violaceomyces palustris TaxID=1673888 RepID=A0ACD0NMU3_9BASI|nr:hypothetical protein IE53DRAFT_390733 [Violaceomyces palustris]